MVLVMLTSFAFICFFFYRYGYHRVLHLLTHSFPTRRSSDRPWSLGQAGGRPLRHCGTPYTGINTLYLWAIADAEGYRSRYWMTYRQAEALGGNVRRGETGAVSVYYSSFKKHEAPPETGQDVIRSIRFLRPYTVFNADQTQIGSASCRERVCQNV